MFTKKLLIPVFMFAMVFAANISYSQDIPKQNDANVISVPPGGTVSNENEGIDDKSQAVGYAFDEKTVMAVDDGKNIGKGKNGISVRDDSGETNTNASTDVNYNR